MEFLIDMSHQIRTPLSTILGFGEVLNKEESNTKKELEEEIEIIKDSANELTYLIDNLLDVSKLEKNDIELEDRTIKDQLKKLITAPGMEGYWTKNIRPKVSSQKNTEDACKKKLKDKIDEEKAKCNPDPETPLKPIQVLERIEKVLYVLFFCEGDLSASIDEIP